VPAWPGTANAVEVVRSQGEAAHYSYSHLHLAEDPEESPGRLAKVPLRAEFTDSTTCRRPIEIRHAVVPEGMRCERMLKEHDSCEWTVTLGALSDGLATLHTYLDRDDQWTPEQEHRLPAEFAGPTELHSRRIEKGQTGT